MPSRKLISRGSGVGPWGRPMGVLPLAAMLRRAASRRRPAAPLRGDSPRASLRGCALSSASSRGRFGEFVMTGRFVRRGELRTFCAGEAMRGSGT